jgi:hypothetical protein
MASAKRGDEKATWSQMAERWLACAKQSDDQYKALQFRIESEKPKTQTKLAPRWADEPRLS